MARVFQQIISLGPDCRTIHQIRESFRKASGRRGVFDWQLTPPAAVIEYLRRDFVGMFEREDLQIVDGRVINPRFSTSYKHLFPANMTEEMLNAHYAAVRASHDRWCRTSRSLIGNGLSTLFVLGRPAMRQDMDELAMLIEQASPGRDFLLLAAPDGDNDDDWMGNHSLWREHLSRFEIRPPLARRVKLKIYRWGKKFVLKDANPLAGSLGR